MNGIIEELKRDEKEPVPDFITIFSPENYNAENTDEYSGDEIMVSLHNLPGSQLRAPAEINCSEPLSDSDTSDDYVIPFTELVKQRRLIDASRYKRTTAKC